MPLFILDILNTKHFLDGNVLLETEILSHIINFDGVEPGYGYNVVVAIDVSAVSLRYYRQSEVWLNTRKMSKTGVIV